MKDSLTFSIFWCCIVSILINSTESRSIQRNENFHSGDTKNLNILNKREVKSTLTSIQEDHLGFTLLLSIGILGGISLLLFILILCVNSKVGAQGEPPETTVGPIPDNFYLDAALVSAHNRQSNDKMQCSSLPEAEQGQQEEIFESTGDKEADSYQEQCQGKVKSKKNSVKARKVKRSSIILSNLLASELVYCYVPPMCDRQTMSKEALLCKWEVTDYSSLLSGEDLRENVRQPFWYPANTMEDVYTQMSQQKYIEIPSRTISLGGHLDVKQHNAVTTYRGVWDSPNGDAMVVVKVLSNKTSNEIKLKFLQEAAILGQLRHPNILKLHGIVSILEPLMLIMEYVSEDLRNHLLGYRVKLSMVSELSMLPTELLRYCKEIAMGMSYLACKGYIHKNLMARNVLLDKHKVCKISAFDQQAKYLEEMKSDSPSDLGSNHGDIRWTSPEALMFNRYNASSDVWSYGMVLYEIWSLGNRPFEDIPNQKVSALITTGYCQPPPPGCPKPIYSIMVECWNPEYKERPIFDEISGMLKAVETSVLMMLEKKKDSEAEVNKLGGPLKDGYTMYKDLQLTYTKHN